MGVVIWYGCAPTYMYIHTCVQKVHVQKLQMATTMEASMLSCLTCVYEHIHVSVCMYMWVPPPPKTCELNKNVINLELIEIIWFLSSWNSPSHGLVYQLISGGSSQITKNLIYLFLNEIIQFCLKIYDLWQHLHLWIEIWVDWWGHVKSLKFE